MSVKTKQQGFTIIELMIATTVMSVLLLLVTIIIVNIGNLYYKGITQARAQDNARAILDDVSQRVRTTDSKANLSPLSLDTFSQAYCLGSVRYTYALNRQVGPSQRVLWRDNIAPGACPAPANTVLTGPVVPATGTEMITPRARLTNFCITGSGSPPCNPNGGSPYTITVDIAVGDDDQLCNSLSAPTSDCNDTSIPDVTHLSNLKATSRKILCRGHLGNAQQFCATANLTTTSVQRLR